LHENQSFAGNLQPDSAPLQGQWMLDKEAVEPQKLYPQLHTQNNIYHQREGGGVLIKKWRVIMVSANDIVTMKLISILV